MLLSISLSLPILFKKHASSRPRSELTFFDQSDDVFDEQNKRWAAFRLLNEHKGRILQRVEGHVKRRRNRFTPSVVLQVRVLLQPRRYRRLGHPPRDERLVGVRRRTGAPGDHSGPAGVQKDERLRDDRALSGSGQEQVRQQSQPDLPLHCARDRPHAVRVGVRPARDALLPQAGVVLEVGLRVLKSEGVELVSCLFQLVLVGKDAIKKTKSCGQDFVFRIL